MPVKVETSIKEEKVPLGAAVAIKREASPSASDEDGAEEDEEESNWWELENLRIASKGEKRWDTLSHNGVQFPPLYVPHGIPIRYEGKEFRMTPDEEEVATMFAVLKESEYYKNPLFRTNFFRSWRAILDKRAEPHPIRRLELCDFEAIYQWHVREREKRLSRSREEKKEAQRLANEEAEPYKTCLWNGKQEQVANFRVEPPGLFRGRGKHPLAGKLKKRLQAEDITINIGKEAEVPAPPPGHHWAAVQHDNTVTWLAMWRDNVAGNFKYVMLAPSSSVKGQSDMMKFERARKLKTVVDDIRASYTEDFRSSSKQVAQRAVAMYFIDKLALRVGNEKGSDEADTVGCCSLRVEHIKLLPHNGVRFDFLGKDSIRYQNEVTVLPEVHALLQKFTHGRRPDSDIFNELTTTQLNDHLKSFMDGLTAKVFRTYNASITLDRWFKEKPVDPKMSVADKLAYFNKANTEVAVLCNHQKAVSKNHHSQMAVLGTKSTYTRQIIEQLERAMETIQKKSLKAAVDEFFAEQDRIQLEWLKAYGTDEQREDYETIRKNRGMPKQKSASTRKSSTSGEKKKKRSSSSRKTATKKKTSAKKTSSKKSKTPTKKVGSKRGSKKEESDEDDVPLHQLAKAGAAKKTTPKKPAAKRPRVKAEDSDDDDVPLANLLA